MSKGVLREATGNGDIVEIPRTFKSYEVIRTIGCGSQAVVVAIRDLETGVGLAAKVLPRPPSGSQALRFIERELRFCLPMQCQFLVNCVEIVYLPDIICIVMENCDGGDLFEVCTNNRPEFVRYWRRMFVQLALGLQYLHKRGLAHRDIKMENVLVDGRLNVKLCDYGVMCESQEDNLSTSECGTIPYMAPEMIKGEGYCPMKVDVWALGITLFAAVTGFFPWKSKSDAGLKDEILEGKFEVKMVGGEMKEVILKCCERNPYKRATIDEVLALPFLRDEVKRLERGGEIRREEPTARVRGALSRCCIDRHVSDGVKRVTRSDSPGRTRIRYRASGVFKTGHLL